MDRRLYPQAQPVAFPKDPSRNGKMIWIYGAPDTFSADDEAVHDRLGCLLVSVFTDKILGDQETLIPRLS